MSVKRFVETIESPESEFREKGASLYTRTFRVQTTRNNEDPKVIRAHPMCPRIGAVFNSRGAIDTAATCTSVAITATEAATVQHVVCRYSSEGLKERGFGSAEELLNAPPIMSWTINREIVTTKADARGKPYLNTLKYQLDPPPRKDVSRLHLTILKNQAAYDPRLALSYADKVNSDAWFGFKPSEVKCAGIAGDEAWEAALHYWIVAFEFDFRLLQKLPGGDGMAGFQPIEVINASGVYWDPVAQKLKVADDEFDTAYNGVVRIAINGRKLTRLEPSYWLKFHPYEEAPFAPLGLP